MQHEPRGPVAEGRNNLFSDPALTEIGESHGQSVAQVVLRWLTQCKIAVITKSVRRDRMVQDFDILDFDLTRRGDVVHRRHGYRRLPVLRPRTRQWRKRSAADDSPSRSRVQSALKAARGYATRAYMSSGPLSAVASARSKCLQLQLSSIRDR